MVTRRMRGVRCPFLGIDGFISVAVHHADSRRDVFFAAHDQVRAKWHSCAIDRSHFQALPVGQHDLVPFCNTCVDAGSDRHRLREHDSRNLSIVAPRCKLPGDVDRVAYRSQCMRCVVATLADIGQPRVQVNYQIGGRAEFLCEAIT